MNFSQPAGSGPIAIFVSAQRYGSGSRDHHNAGFPIEQGQVRQFYVGQNNDAAGQGSQSRAEGVAFFLGPYAARADDKGFNVQREVVMKEFRQDLEPGRGVVSAQDGFSTRVQPQKTQARPAEVNAEGGYGLQILWMTALIWQARQPKQVTQAVLGLMNDSS